MRRGRVRELHLDVGEPDLAEQALQHLRGVGLGSLHQVATPRRCTQLLLRQLVETPLAVRVVITVTPVAKLPMAARRCWGLKSVVILILAAYLLSGSAKIRVSATSSAWKTP